MTTAPVRRLVCELAAPTIVSMLVTSLYNLVSTFYVGQISTQATAAVGVAFAAMALIHAVGFFFGHGSGNYLSRCLGKRNGQEAARMAATGFFCALAAGGLIAIAGRIWLEPLCLALGSTPTILPSTEAYLGTVLLGAPLMSGSLVLNNQLRYQGNAHLGMIGIVSGAVLNIGLAPVFIFVLGWGIKGAAVATVVCQGVSLAILWLINKHRGTVQIRLSSFSPSRSMLAELTRGGLPSLARQSLACIATLLLNVAASRYGDDAVAGMSIATRVTHFIYAFFLGFCQGYQPLCGFNYGAGRYGRVLRAFWFCVRVGTVGLLVCSAFGIVFADGIIGLFCNDSGVIAVGSTALTWQLFIYPLNVFMTMSSMTLQTIGRAKPAVVLASARQGLFFLPAILLLPEWTGLTGVQLATPVADACSFLLAIVLIRRTLMELSLTR